MHAYTCAYTYVFHVNTRRGLQDLSLKLSLINGSVSDILACADCVSTLALRTPSTCDGGVPPQPIVLGLRVEQWLNCRLRASTR